MKKKYSFLGMCGLLAACFAFDVNAQALSGNYTIDNTQPATATNFTSFTQFANSLNTNGVSGPVTVNVGNTSGPYVEQIRFNQISGMSSTNSVTINGNGRIIRFTSNSSTLPSTFDLNGTDYMFVHNLQVEALGSTYGQAVHLYNNADNNQFHGCYLMTPLNGTGTYQNPFSISGGVLSLSSGQSGSGNTASTCTMTGGYYNTVLYGNFTSPYSTANRILDCHIIDFYYMGVYLYYHRNVIIRGNVFERKNRTTMTSPYVLYITTTQGTTIEKNHIRSLFDASQPSSMSAYPIYSSGTAPLNDPLIIRNNIISDIKTNGSIYAMYLFHSGTYVEHNTISIDDANTSGSHTTYGMYHGANNMIVRNNIFSLTRQGSTSSNRYAMYIGSTSYFSGSRWYNNVYHVNGPTGNNYIGYLPSTGLTYTNTTTGFSNWKSALNDDWNTKTDDPMFVSVTWPNSDVEPTNPAINNMAVPVGVPDDFYSNPRAVAMPDPGAIEFFTTPCSTVPSPGTFAVPTISVCPGSTVNLALSTGQFTNSGFSLQWQASTLSPVGGFNSVSGATLSEITTPPLNVTTYYQVVVQCMNSTASATTAAMTISVALPTSSTAPYHEDFESMAWNRLPNCDWSSSISSQLPSSPTYTTPESGLRVPRNGIGYAAFSAAVTGPQDFYTNPIFLQPGITYSASVWHINQTPATTDWSSLELNIGMSQSSTGQLSIATKSPVTGTLYQSLSNTFVVTAPGMYYLNVRATAGSGAGKAPWLSFDDLRIDIPCSLNSPVMMLSSNTQTVCANQPVVLQAIGADTYLWNTGATSSGIVNSPASDPAIYTVIGTHTLSGCTTMMSTTVSVVSGPQVAIGADKQQACQGQPLTLTAIGNAQSYMWAHGPSGAVTTVVPPSGITIYSVTGSNSQGCFNVAQYQVTVNPNPGVNVTPASSIVCVGDNVILSAVGASSYQWLANQNVVYLGSTINFIAQQSMNFDVTGTNEFGCTGKDNFVLNVLDCTGLQENSGSSVRVYPNPASTSFIVDAGSQIKFSVIISDVTGRTIGTHDGTGTASVSVNEFAAGIYYVTIAAENSVQTIKLIKE